MSAVAVPVPPGMGPAPVGTSLRPWMAGAAVVWGGLALLALVGPFAAWPTEWRYACFAIATGIEAALFAGAARRPDFRGRLRVAMWCISASFLVSAVSYVHSAMAVVGWIPALPAVADAGVTFLTYAVAVVGLLRWPMAPLSRARWWHFGLDATVGTVGMGLFFLAIATLPGAEHASSVADRLSIYSFSGALLLDVVALNVVMVRGLPLPSRRAFWTYMAALILEMVSLVLIQYFTVMMPPGRISNIDDAVYILVQLLYVWAGILYLRDPRSEPEAEPVPTWMLTFNPLPLLAIAGVGALFLSESSRGDGPLESALAAGLVVLVALQTIRLMATVWENARLVRRHAALQAEKLEALRRIAGGISHEFNNMLTAVIGHAELGLSEVEPTSRVGRDLEGIRSAADRASLLTRELLAFSGGQFTGRMPLDLGAELFALAPRMRQILGPRSVLMVPPPAEPVVVLGDAPHLREVLLTLARHAERRMPNGGTLTLGLATVALEAPRRVGPVTLEPGRYARLEVADTGRRLSDGALARIFEPYFSPDAGAAMPLIGLASVQGVVLAHQGGLEARSETERGLELTLYLPLAPGAAAPGPPVVR